MLDKLDVFDNRVRERAFALWQEAGCPENTAEAFWHHARQTEMQKYKINESDLERAAHEREPNPADFA